MGTPELSIPLTEDERQILSGKRNRALMLVPVFAILAVLLLASLFVFQTLYCFIALPLFSLVLAVRALLSLFSFLSLSRDLKQGTKQIISGPVEAQNMDVSRSKNRSGVEGSASYTFWIQVKGKKLTVTEEQYYQFKKGDLVEAFIAPNSGTVFGVNKEQLKRPFG
jgi:hypothetical protein